MKRVGRRGRLLGSNRYDEDVLDAVTQKHLLEAAGITLDVLQEMSDDEKQGTLTAILESCPLLLKNIKEERLSTGEVDTSFSDMEQSSLEILDPDTGTQSISATSTDRKQLSAIAAHFSSEEEQETQPYDMPESDTMEQRVALSDSPQESLDREKSPGTGTEIDGTGTQDQKLATQPASCGQALAHTKLQPSMVSEEETPLTRIYRKHPKQEKAMLIPRFYAPENFDPDSYTQVIQLMFDIYLRRVSRACRQVAEVTKIWGKPVTAGPHLHGCLVAASREIELVEDGGMNRRRRKLRSRLCKPFPGRVGVGQKGHTEDEIEEAKFDRSNRSELRSQGWLKDSKNKLRERGDMSGAVISCHQPAPSEMDERDDLNEQTSDSGCDEWLSVTCKQAFLTNRNKIKTSQDRKQTQVNQISERQGDTQDKLMKASSTICSDLKKTGKQSHVIKDGKARQSWIRLECDNVIGECEIQSQHKWQAGQESQPRLVHCTTLRGDRSETRDDNVVSKPQLLQQGRGVEAETVSMSMKVGDIESSSKRANEDMTPPQCHDGYWGYEMNQDQARSAAPPIGAPISSQCSESLLDMHGDLYSTQVSRVASSLSLGIVPSITSDQQDDRRRGQRSVWCAGSGSSQSIDEQQLCSNKADVNVQVAENRTGKADTTGLMGHQLTNIDASDLGGLETHPQGHIDGSRDLAMKERSDRSKPDIKRKLMANMVLAKGQTLDKRRKVDTRQLPSSTRALARKVGLPEGGAADVAVCLNNCGNSSSDVDCILVGGPAQTLEGPPDNMCPICGKSFSSVQLVAHASTCGEDGEPVRCVCCGLHVPPDLIGAHRAVCQNVQTKRITRSTRE